MDIDFESSNIEAEINVVKAILKLSKSKETLPIAKTLAEAMTFLSVTDNFSFIDINEYVTYLDDITYSHDNAEIMRLKIQADAYKKQINDELNIAINTLLELKVNRED